MARPFNKIMTAGETFEDMFSAYRLKQKEPLKHYLKEHGDPDTLLFDEKYLNDSDK